MSDCIHGNQPQCQNSSSSYDSVDIGAPDNKRLGEGMESISLWVILTLT